MSFQKGIIFIGKKHVACSYTEKNGKQVTWLKPLNPATILQTGKLVYFSMPRWYHLIFWFLLISVFVPPLLNQLSGQWELVELPLFPVLFFLFGTHFWFPKELKKYHGAEHKVFSYKGIISVVNRRKIERALITNRNCSTNGVLLYFVAVFLITTLMAVFSERGIIDILDLAAIIALVILPLLSFWLRKGDISFLRGWVLTASYWLQKHVTTADPDIKHINMAIRSYRKLALMEFPARAIRPQIRKEKVGMAIADITIIPIGSNTTSVSSVVAEIHLILKRTNKPITYELTPMSTLIEGELPVLLEVIKEIHEVPFKLGHQRVATNIRIDDRRDKPSSMSGKLKAVQGKLNSSESGDKEIEG